MNWDKDLDSFINRDLDREASESCGEICEECETDEHVELFEVTTYKTRKKLLVCEFCKNFGTYFGDYENEGEEISE